MDLPNELWYNVFSFLSQKSQSKFSCLLNLHNLSTEEIQLVWSSNNLWADTARKGYTKLMKLLIKNGTIVNIQDNRGYTALHLASRYGHKDCVELLIKTDGININKQDNDNWIALHWASRYHYKKIAKLLIKAGTTN